MLNGNYQIGIDIGGTFTDVVILEPDSGRLTVGKKLTSSDRPAQAVIQVISQMLEKDPDTLLIDHKETATLRSTKKAES